MKYYIDFTNVYHNQPDHWKQKDIINAYIAWLNKNAGKEEEAWYWKRGDMLAKGVYIKDKAAAVAFKLRFET